MKEGYFSDEFCDDLAEYSRINPPGSPYFNRMRNKIKKHGIHFKLPDGGYVLPNDSDTITIDTDTLKPPYPVSVIEYPVTSDDLRAGETSSTKRLVLAVDEQDSVVLFPAYFIDEADKWIPPVLYWRIKYGCRFSLSRTVPKELKDEDGLSWNEGWPGAFAGLKAPMTIDQYAARELANINQEISVYIDMCMALADYEVEMLDHKPDERTRKLRRLRGKPPPYTYKIITITGKKKERRSLGGTHASPVAHLRRGHWRHYKSGKRVWVDAMVVNGTYGMLVKDYRVEKRV